MEKGILRDKSKKKSEGLIKDFFVTIQIGIEKHPILMLSFLMLGTAIYVFYQFLFEGQVFAFADVGADTQHVYYPFFSSVSRKLEQGDWSLWDFSYGVGVNVLTRQADIGSIFTYLLCIFGADTVKYGLIWIHVLKIFISGYLCYFYLCNFRFRAIPKVLASYIFAFNSFICLWGQHYFFGSACICIVLMLWAIEKGFKSSKGFIFTAISTFIVMCTSYYFAYMVLLFSGVYALFRMVYLYPIKEVKKIFKTGLGLLSGVCLGASMAAFIFIPAVYIITNTSARLSSDVGMFDKMFQIATSTYNKEMITAIVSRVFSNNLMGTYDFVGPANYYELPQWSFSCLNVFVVVILVLDLILNCDESKRGKVIKSLALLVVIFTMFHPFISFAFNGFVEPFFRYTFLFMPILGLSYADVFEKMLYNKLRFPRIQIVISAFVSLVILIGVIGITNATSEVAQKLGQQYLQIILIFTVAMFLIQGQSKRMGTRVICIVCSIMLVVVNICIENHATNNERIILSNVNSNIYVTSGNVAVSEAISELNENDKTFFRTEKMFQDVAFLNDSLIQGYYGISTYNSVINKYLIEFKDQLCPDFQVDNIRSYNDFRRIYRNVNVISLLGVKYILTQDYINDIPEYEYVKSIDNVHIYQNTATQGIARFITNAIDYDEFSALSIEEKNDLIKDTVVLKNLGEKITKKNTKEESTVSFERPTNSSHVEGIVDAKQEGWVFVAIPFEQGWKAYVDGVETEIFQADIGYSAIKVQKGLHNITLQYRTPCLVEGIVISCVGTMIFTVWCINIYLQTKRLQKMRRVRKHRTYLAKEKSRGQC